jgi:hypothetical protein
MPTRFRVRVLTKKLGKRFTTASRSPVISAAPAAPGPALAPAAAPPAPLAPAAPDAPAAETLPDGDYDGDGQLNRDDADDDNDLLPDAEEARINAKLVAKTPDIKVLMDPLNEDTDGDTVEDGYEYRSAQDLNDDENQEPNKYLPYPGKRPYANPLFNDVDTDYDGDTLTLGEEYALWKYVGNRTLTPLSYSDGEQYSASHRLPNGHREPTLEAANYAKQADFVDWATNTSNPSNTSGYRNVTLWDGQGYWYQSAHQSVKGLFDANRDGTESPSELTYNDIDGDGYLSDDERDEDADGLTNFDESHGRVLPDWWSSSCYPMEKPYYVSYAGTDLDDEDSDGDGVRDGADDQDHDDIPNVMELSRRAASGLDDRKKTEGKKTKDCVPKEGGNFSVSGGPLPNGSLVVTFKNELGNRDVAQMTASGAGLTPREPSADGTPAPTPDVTVDTTRQGTFRADGGGLNEKQTVKITGGPAGGGFTLTFDDPDVVEASNTTAQLAFSADAATVEAALNELVPTDTHPDAFGRVNPFNPCLPFKASRTCTNYDNGNTGAPFDDSVDWLSLN